MNPSVDQLPSRALVLDPERSLAGGCLAMVGKSPGSWFRHQVEQLSEALEFDLHTPWRRLPEEVRQVLMYGTDGEHEFVWEGRKGAYPEEPLYTVEDALEDYQGSIIEPIFMSTAQAFRDADEMEAALAYLILQQQDSVGLVTFDREIRAAVRPSRRNSTSTSRQNSVASASCRATASPSARRCAWKIPTDARPNPVPSGCPSPALKPGS